MTTLLALFNGLPDIARIMLLLSLIAAAGLAFGQIKIKGVGLGIGGVLFAGIAGGHLAAVAGMKFDLHVLHFLREFGLILFVYTIGVQVGPGFFAALKRSGLTLNLLAAALVGLGVLVTVVIHKVAGVPLPAVLGLFSGAVTNTPSLGAAQQILAEVGRPPPRWRRRVRLRHRLSLRHRRHSDRHDDGARRLPPGSGSRGDDL